MLLATMKRFPSLLVVIYFLHSGEAVVNPGLQVVITPRGFTYVADVGIPLLEKQLSSIAIPAISGRASTPVGDVDYDLSNIKLGTLSIPTYSLTTGTSGVDLKCSDVAVSAKANWHYRESSWPHIEDSGSADFSMGGSSLGISVVLGRDGGDGHMTLKTTGCSLNIGSLSIEFHGGASWLYNLFDSEIEDSLKGSLSSTICKTAIQYIDTSGNVAVESIPVVSKLSDTVEINYELLYDPIFKPTYFQTGHKGEFYSVANPTEAPFDTPVVPDGSSVDGSKMMYIWVTTFVPNSAGYVYQQSGELHYTINQNTSLPPGIAINTDFFGGFIPQLSKMYPHMPMQLALSVAKYPTVITANNTIYLDVPSTLVAMVQLPNNTLVTAFTMSMILHTTGDVYVNESKGSAEMLGFVDKLLRVDLNLTSSNIGAFDVYTLQKTVNIIAGYFIVPEINSYTNQGIPVPTVEGVTFTDPTITLGKDYIMVATDISWEMTEDI